ncbi:MAG: chemotaxis protein CheW [Sandaracinaceae bacterium]|nr:chemotaxis protein CheW [Sandaracinaceae bacterium]
MDDPLAPFREGERARDAEVETTCERDLLLFEHGGVAYAVPASSVDVVVAWNPPAPLPASVPGFAGVLQDRGRVVAILTSPLARPRAGETEERRIVICSTRRGFIGLPCVRTSDVGPVRLAAAPVPGEVVDSSRGPVVFVDPELLVDELSVGARA